MALAVWSAGAQTLVAPDHVDEVKKYFQAPRAAAPLDCYLRPVRAALDYSFRFEAGYVLHVPLRQYQGAGHQISVYLRITPGGGAPVYLASKQELPPVPETRLDGEFVGHFWIGDGSYRAEMNVVDDLGRACSDHWKIQTRRNGKEREMRASLSPGVVTSRTETLTAASGQAPKIRRMSIFLHAAPLSPRASKLTPDDVRRLSDSLLSVLQQLPAESVRLLVFNLDQRSVLLRKEEFHAADLAEVSGSLAETQLALVDYRTLQNMELPAELLDGLLREELRTTGPRDAVIVMSPQTGLSGDKITLAPPAAAGRLFYLQYIPEPDRRRIPMSPPPTPGRRAVADATFDSVMSSSNTPSLLREKPLPMPDTIERLVDRWKGATMAIAAPGDFAEAIRQIAGRMSTPAAVSPR